MPATDASLPMSGQWTAAGSPQPLWSLHQLFRKYRGRISLTYGLFLVENVLKLLRPLALGLAINDLLQASSQGLIVLIGLLLVYALLSILRRMYDTRAFTSIYTELAAQLVEQQRRLQEPVSRIAARSTMSRSYVDFFERDVPLVVNSIFSVTGAAVLLAWYDPVLVFLCLALLLPAGLLNWLYSRKALVLHERLHDQLEHEIHVIGRGQMQDIRAHYQQVASWRIRLSDLEALNVGGMEVFILAVTAAALLYYCGSAAANPGSIFAVFRYLMMFIMGLDSLPMLVQQISRLRDINRRLGSSSAAEALE